MKRRAIVLLGGAALAVGGAALLLRPREGADPVAAAEPAFPALAPRLPSAARIEIRRHDGALELVRSGDLWTLPAKDGYPARTERVRALLLGLSELRLSEPRTADPDALSRLGLDDPARPNSTAALIRVLDTDGVAIAELLAGHGRSRAGGSAPDSLFVRRPDANQSWLAEGALPTDVDPQVWIDRNIVTIPGDRVLRVVAVRDGAAVEMARAGEADSPLRVVRPAELANAVPAPDDVALDEVGRAFEALSFLDVRRADAPTGEPLGTGEFTITDGLTVRAAVSREDEAIWVRFTAAGGEEAARLNARWRGWAYQVGPWKLKAFAPAAEDLVPPAPAAGTAPSPEAAEPPSPDAPRAP